MYLIGSIQLVSDPRSDQAVASFALASPRAGMAGNSFSRQVAAIDAIDALGVNAQAWPTPLLESMGLLSDNHLRELAHAAAAESIAQR